MSQQLEETLKEAMSITGAIGVALVDFGSGMTLGTIGGGGLDLEIAGAGNTEVVRAKLATMKALGLDDQIEDILITLGTQYHLIRLLSGEGQDGLFLYLALNKEVANLAMARRQLSEVEKHVSV
ncbi:MAG: hypothetical protein AAF547_18195 [Actinomycetota bacterium]